MFLLVCSIAFAQFSGQQIQQRTLEQIQQRTQEANQVMIQARNRTIYKPEDLGQMEVSGQIEKLRGLENAYTNVKNEIAKEAISGNMIRFQARYQYTYNNYQVDKIGNMTHVVAQKRLKVFGFPVTYQDEIVVDDDGEIVQEKLNWIGKIHRWKMFGGKR